MDLANRKSRSIQALESDMAAIRAEHDHQNRTIQEQKVALDRIIGDLGSLRFMGKEVETSTSVVVSPRGTPIPDSRNVETDVMSERATSTIDQTNTESEEQEDGEADKRSEGTMGAGADEMREDIEMGEVEEDPKDNSKSKKKYREELEEGEASDTSSSLSDPPDD
ncbi:hypothetical protein AX15_002348 [Amanita polypyramis BW_CC]|nr:hypothetical protein AX15_002348 [Amanita polypyramis BW_CC]